MPLFPGDLAQHAELVPLRAACRYSANPSITELTNTLVRGIVTTGDEEVFKGHARSACSATIQTVTSVIVIAV
jgi:hypothetical protein